MLNLKRNSEVKELYEEEYMHPDNYFYAYRERVAMLEMLPSWEGKTVLEIGCGRGHLAFWLAQAGAIVTGIDYVQRAINICIKQYNDVPNLDYVCCSFQQVSKRYDVVVMQGVLEHMDEPLEVLKFIKENLLVKGGEIVTSSPSFINPRGYIWMVFEYLFNYRMTGADACQISFFDFEDYAKDLGMKLDFITTDQDWGCGNRFPQDIRQRLERAFKGIPIEINLDKFISWLERAVPYSSISDFSGAIAVYHLKEEI